MRSNGGVPATIGILNGIARVGFEPEELIQLAASAGKPETRKVSRRDLSYICGLVCSSFSPELYVVPSKKELKHFRVSPAERLMVALQSLGP